MRRLWILVLLLGFGSPGAVRSEGTAAELEPRLRHLVAAYPEALDRIEGNLLIWRDGSRTPLDDGLAPKTAAQRLVLADIKDMLVESYPVGNAGLPPASGADPGRARNAAFFVKMYGDCRKGEVQKALTTITWLPKKWGKPLKVTARNGVAEKLAAVSRELDELPATFDLFLFPPAGTFNCRPIAGTNRISAHGYGIAIDLAVSQSDYWRWAKAGPGNGGGENAKDAVATYRNRIPLKIVAIFERHGFIWGGKWSHFDTMHFEYRPELLPALQGAGNAP